MAGSEKFCDLVNDAFRDQLRDGDEQSGIYWHKFPLAINANLVLGSTKVVNQFLHDTSKVVAVRVGDAALEVARMLRDTVDGLTHAEDQSAVMHTPDWYLDVLLRSGRFGPASETSALPSDVRLGLARWLVPKVGSRAGGVSVREVSEVRHSHPLL